MNTSTSTSQIKLPDHLFNPLAPHHPTKILNPSTSSHFLIDEYKLMRNRLKKTVSLVAIQQNKTYLSSAATTSTTSIYQPGGQSARLPQFKDYGHLSNKIQATSGSHTIHQQSQPSLAHSHIGTNY